MMSFSFPSINVRLGSTELPELPEMYAARQNFSKDEVTDIEQILAAGMQRFPEASLAGKRIAITAGSRGINKIGEVLRLTVKLLKQHGAEPFVIPAMGSHGGATAAGQIEVLTNMGWSEDYLGAPIRSSMEVVSLGTTDQGLEVFCDALAYQADGIIVCNRIKPHNAFKADYESGLIKMLIIGLGKHKGAVAAHNLGFDRFGEALPVAAELSLAKAPVLAGIGLIENAYNRLADLQVLMPDEFLSKEPQFLQKAKNLLGRLPVGEIDVLIVDEIGKEFSGGGMDANVTGRSPLGLPGFTAPPIGRIIVRDLSKKTAGNAIGLGLADFTTRRCAEKIDMTTTYTNAITAQSLLSPKIPVIAENDRDALTFALTTLRGGIKQSPKIVRVKNTKDLEEIWLSEAFIEEVSQNPDLEIIGGPEVIRFDDSGTLI